MAERLAPSTRHAFTHHGRLVYEWDQALAEVNMYIPVPPDLRAKEIFCDITKQHLKFGRHGNTPFMDVSAGGASGEEGGGSRPREHASEMPVLRWLSVDSPVTAGTVGHRVYPDAVGWGGCACWRQRQRDRRSQ